jgi:hypothetical protein
MVIVIDTGTKLSALPVFLFSIVDPFRLTVEPELAPRPPELPMENLAPLLTVIVPVPTVTLAVPPANETAPSSTVMPAAVIAEGALMVHALVASVPAEKTAVSPLAKVVAVEPPVESVLQSEPVVFQVPAPVPCPEPAVAPLMSQYLRAA